MSKTLIDIVNRAPSSAPAIGAPGRPWLSYGELSALMVSARAAINEAGAGRGDAVAIVLPNGPEMAAAFIAVAGSATAAPLNPDYKADEFKFYLEDLGAKAIVLEAGAETPARAVARDLGITILDLHADAGGPAGSFKLTSDRKAAAAKSGPAEPADVGLVLHTSGTTSGRRSCRCRTPISRPPRATSARRSG